MPKINFKKMQEYLPGSENNISLKDHTTFHIGGKAKIFFNAKSEDDLLRALKAAKKFNLSFFILGAGSNLLVSDKGFNGLVIKMEIKEWRIRNREITAGAGADLSSLVKAAAEKCLSGLEWAAGIPGTVGGAIYGNAKVFDKEMGGIVKSAIIFDSQKNRVLKFSKKDCAFSYKTSIFKKKKHLIIVSAKLALSSSGKKEIKDKVKNNLDYRKKAQPKMLPSAGSVFINPRVRITDKKLLKEFPKLIDFNKRGFMPAGFLIDCCNLRGKTVGGAKISEKHANFIINAGGATAKNVLKLINLIKRKVKNKFGVELEAEVQILK